MCIRDRPKVDADASASIKGAASDQKEGQHTDSRRAVIYFSSPDSSDMNALEGSTQYLGRVIAEKTGADVFRIVPIKAYPTDYSAHTAQALSLIHIFGTFIMRQKGADRCCW